MNLKKHTLKLLIAASSLFLVFPTLSFADCKDLPDHNELSDALNNSVFVGGAGNTNGGFNLNMWATIVDRDGVVCAVTFTGENRGDQWPGSRVISAQKANTANAFSLPGLALSTANLWAATQPGGSLFGLQFSNPVDPTVAYGQAGPGGTNARHYGQPNDPLTRRIVGGVNVFGGGLALYDSDSEGTLLGAIGVSGDSSCADHNIAWRTRDFLGLDNVPGGVAPVGNPAPATDNIIFDLDGNGNSPSGFGHPLCEVSDEVPVNACVVGDHPTGVGNTADPLTDCS